MPGEVIPEEYKSIADDVLKRIDENFNASKKKKPQSVDSAGLTKIKGIQHHSCRRVQFAKQKVMAACWSPTPKDTRMAMSDQLGMCTVFNTNKQNRLVCFRKTFVKSLALHGDPSKNICLVGSMTNAIDMFVQEGGAPYIPTAKKSCTPLHWHRW